MKKYAVILAGGEGRRAGGELPKQFVKLLGIPMLWWSVRAFHEEDPATEIAVVMHPGFFADWDILISELPEEDRHIPVRLVAGGRSRGESVANGLVGIPADADALVAVHDAARPLVTPAMIRRSWSAAANRVCAVPAVPLTDSIRQLHADGSEAADRSRFVAVQTPQTAPADILHKAYSLPERPDFTDDASRVEAAGFGISLYEGAPENMKVTNPGDFVVAEALLNRKK